MLLVCGPCSAESFEQVYSSAQMLKDLGVDYFRAGLWKPRTHPNNFEGVKESGIEWLKRVKKDFGLRICTEVTSPYTAQICEENDFDAVWIGARTTQNPFIVEDIATALQDSKMTVMVKNPLNPDVDLWLGAIERLEKHGIKSVMAIHRGFSTEYNRYRQSPLWRIPLELKQLRGDIPIICDPSHIAGDNLYVKDIVTTAVSIGFDGLMIETHINPTKALTDAKQQLDIKQLSSLLGSLPNLNNTFSLVDKKINSLRGQIDDIDDTIIRALRDRMQVSREIAKIKKDEKIIIYQADRWQKVLDNVLENAKKSDLNVAFVKELYEIIHQESIKEQDLIINKSEDKE